MNTFYAILRMDKKTEGLRRSSRVATVSREQDYDDKDLDQDKPVKHKTRRMQRMLGLTPRGMREQKQRTGKGRNEKELRNERN